MDTIINKNDLFGDKYRAFVLCEYTRELNLIKQLIHVAEDGLRRKLVNTTWSFEGVCHSFAKTIVDYSKMAYDNLILGHFDATNMINRAILENCVLLDIIVNHDEHELWKYYLAYSYRSIIFKPHRSPKKEDLDLLDDFYSRHDVNEEFYTVQPGERKAYICKPYGWTYKINKNFSFSGVCKLVNETEYLGFQIMSEYSHSTSLYTKMESSITVGNIMRIFIDLYIELYRMIMLYCCDSVDDSFYQLSEEIEEVFYRFIEYEEEHFSCD